MTFTPTQFYKNGVQKTAHTASEAVFFKFDGWATLGPAPEPPRSSIGAHLSDIDNLILPVSNTVADLGFKGIIAQASSETGLPTTCTVDPAAPAPIPGCVVGVPALPANIKLWLKWQVVFGITVAGAGRLNSSVWDLTGGGATAVAVPYTFTTSTVPAVGLYGGLHQFEVEVEGPILTPRIFTLHVGVSRDAGSSLAAYSHNLPAVSGRSHLIAEGR